MGAVLLSPGPTGTRPLTTDLPATPPAPGLHLPLCPYLTQPRPTAPSSPPSSILPLLLLLCSAPSSLPALHLPHTHSPHRMGTPRSSHKPSHFTEPTSQTELAPSSPGPWGWVSAYRLPRPAPGPQLEANPSSWAWQSRQEGPWLWLTPARPSCCPENPLALAVPIGWVGLCGALPHPPLPVSAQVRTAGGPSRAGLRWRNAAPTWAMGRLWMWRWIR